LYITIGGFTLDDTVTPDGSIYWAAPGGNALYSAVGARLWGVEVGIVARIGPDYPQAYLDRLVAAGLDLNGVRRIDTPSFHVWILHEGGGRRQIIYRLDSGHNQDLDPVPDDIPEEYLTSCGAHICPIRGDSQSALSTFLGQRGIPLFLDLIVIPGQIESELFGPAAWQQVRAFLPGIEEVQALWGNHPLPALLREVRASVPGCFAIKMGANGSLVYHPAEERLYHVPAYTTRVVDATGAGDAYCGGFMVGLQKTGHPVEAALRGTVSASFVIEDFGALHALQIPMKQAEQRLESLRARVIPIEGAEQLAGVQTTISGKFEER